jgi:hypothetical protein
MVGGAMSGYSAKGKFAIATNPHKTIIIEITEEKTGFLIKKRSTYPLSLRAQLYFIILRLFEMELQKLLNILKFNNQHQSFAIHH